MASAIMVSRSFGSLYLYERVDEVSIMSIIGIRVYERVGNICSIAGIIFDGYKPIGVNTNG
jgi:hypothetical protein